MSTTSNITNFRHACQNLLNNPDISDANGTLKELIDRIRVHQERWFDSIADILPDSADFQHIITIGKTLSHDQVRTVIQSLRKRPAKEQAIPDSAEEQAVPDSSAPGLDILHEDVLTKIVNELSIQDASQFCQVSRKQRDAVNRSADHRWNVIKTTSNNETLNALITEIDAHNITPLRKLYELCHRCNPMVSSQDLIIGDITPQACIQQMKDHATLVLCQELCEIIPDNNFRTTLQTHLDNQDLTNIRDHLSSHARLLAQITMLDLSHKLLFMVPEEIRHCTRVTHLHLHSNQIQQIDANTFSGLQALVFLDLSDNAIQHIDANVFSNLHTLKHLYLENNQIEHIIDNTFSNLHALETLDLHYNEIQEIEANTFSNLPALQDLNLHHNRIQEIEANTFSNLHALITLDLNYNSIQEIEANTFSNLLALTALYLGGNYIPSTDHLILPHGCRMHGL